MESEEVRRHLEETGALLQGHFLLSSGLHSEHYVQCARVLAWPSRAGLFGSALGAFWVDESVDVVVGPAMGGILIAHEVARYLGTMCLFTEREDGKMTFRRGFQIEAGMRVLVVEDVVTTGGSAKEVVELLDRQRAEVVGVSSLLWRAPEADEGREPASPFGELPFRPLLKLQFQAQPPRECPQCLAKKPIEKPGSRAMTPSAVAGGEA